jgi:hypothetical protein
MTAFTVGHTKNYDDILRNGYAANQGFPVGSPAMKVGRTNDLYGDGSNKFYGGGCVFETADLAAQFLIAIGKSNLWSVYEIDADYHRDCYDDASAGPFRCLLRDARILRKIEKAP